MKETVWRSDLTKIIIVGVTHDNERLADEMLEFLTLLQAHDKFDCFFVEYATDLQDEFDRAVKERDVVRFDDAFYYSWKPLILTAYAGFGYNSDAQQANIARMLERGVRDIPRHSPINRELLTYLRDNRISLLAYDAHSRSNEMVEIAGFVIRENWRFSGIPEPDADMRAARVKNNGARNLIMAENIIAKFSSHQCNKAVVEVGTGHIWEKGQLERYYGITLDTYTPLHVRLKELGFSTGVAGKLLGQRKP